MTVNVLFLCPHGAAKSTSSVAFLQRVAAQRDLDLDVRNAGTDPDAEVLPIVRQRLEADGLGYRTPRLLDDADLEWADLVVNIGCDLDGFTPSSVRSDWSIPNFSDDPEAAFASIEAHVTGLVAGLALSVPTR